MSDAFNKLKEKYGVQPKEPLYLPDLFAQCDHCERSTPTKVLFMRQGLGNACAVCGRFRRGKPYLSKVEFEALKPSEANGGTDEKHNRV